MILLKRNTVLKLFLIVFTIVSTYRIYPQKILIYTNAPASFSSAALHLIKGENLVFIDSLLSKDDRSIYYSFDSSKYSSGLYRVQFNKQKFINIIIDKEPIKIEIEVDKLPEGIKILESESNRYYQRYFQLNNEYKVSTDILNYVLQKYPLRNEYYETTLTEATLLRKNYNEFILDVKNKLPNSLISRYINSHQFAFVDFTLLIEEQLRYLKSHALDGVDFEDYSLVNTDVFAAKAIEYLMFYRNPQLPKELLEKEFMSAVDSLLSRARKSESVYKHLVEYLIEGFKKFGFDLIIDYIVSNYVIEDDICLDIQIEKSIERRINQNKFLKVGNSVPPLQLQDNMGRLVELKEINAEKILIIFYSTNCPHCKDILPKISDIYKTHPHQKLEVLAVSIDANREDWAKYITENEFTWINLHETKSWEGKSISDYYIYATPTMFLLDNEEKILAKPITHEELKNLIENGNAGI